VEVVEEVRAKPSKKDSPKRKQPAGNESKVLLMCDFCWIQMNTDTLFV
jgi:hypothetical protein